MSVILAFFQVYRAIRYAANLQWTLDLNFNENQIFAFILAHSEKVHTYEKLHFSTKV